MRKYWLVFVVGFQSNLEYRFDLVWRILSTVISTVMLYVFWTAVLGTGFGQSKYTTSSLGFYYLLITFVSVMTGFSFRDVSDDIRNGYLATYLIKPYNYFLAIFIAGLSDKVLYTVLFTLIFIVLRINGIVFHFGPLAILSIVLAGILTFIVSVGMGSLAFWFKRVHGFNSLFYNFGGIFSGELIPLDLLPVGVLAIGNYLPFKYMAYYPTQLLLRGETSSRSYIDLALQLFWIVFFGLIALFIWKKGLSKFEASGR